MLSVRSLSRFASKAGIRAASTAKETVRVCVTGSGGLIGYSLVPMIASGQMFGPDTPVAINMLDINMESSLKGLNGLAMELDDCAYPLLRDVVVTTDANEGFKDCDAAVFCGAFPRGPGMERKDLLTKNAGIFNAQGKAVAANAKPNIKCLVVGNPANTNAMLLQRSGNLPPQNITALTRLDQNRAITHVSRKMGIDHNNVNNVVIWGNHSATQFPDVSQGTAIVNGKEVPLAQAIGDDAWVQGEFVTNVAQRGALVIKTRGSSSATSAARATVDSMRDWWCGTKPGEYVSMAVYSNGNPYGIAEGIYYSFPCTSENGEWKIVGGLPISEFARGKMQATEKELLEEQATALAA